MNTEQRARFRGVQSARLVCQTFSLILAISFGTVRASTNPFAAEVISSQGPFGPSPYNDPQSILGEPATNYYEFGAKTNTRVKLFETTYNYSVANGVTNRLLTTFGNGSFAIVRFDDPITNDPANPYGIDFLVFGNAFYIADAFGDAANLNTVNLFSGAFTEPLWISVSPGFTGQVGEAQNDPTTWPWYRYENGPFGDSAFPTHAYQWDREAAAWTDEKMDFTKPVNPLLFEMLDNGGLTAADAVELYTGSGGGTGFDLQESGFNSVRYVRIEALPESNAGEIDAISIVRPRTLGESLSVLPTNITNNTARLVFQRPESKTETAFAIQFTSLSDNAQVTARSLEDTNALAAIPAALLLGVMVEISPLLGTTPVEFTSNIALGAGSSYGGSGGDLRLLSWNGTNWTALPFTFDSANRQASISGITNVSAFALVQFAAPAVTMQKTSFGFAFQFTPVPHCLHALERSTNLVNWTTLTTVTSANREPITWEDQNPPGPQAFYRLRLVIPEE